MPERHGKHVWNVKGHAQDVRGYRKHVWNVKGHAQDVRGYRKHVWNGSAWMGSQSLLMRNIECSKKSLPLGNSSSLVEKFQLFPRITEGSMSLPHFWLRWLRQNSFFTEILWNVLYRIKKDAPPAPPRIPQKFHNFLDFYTAPPKFTHAPPKFTHFRSISSGDISILVEWLKVTISPELPKLKNGSADKMNVTWSA